MDENERAHDVTRYRGQNVCKIHHMPENDVPSSGGGPRGSTLADAPLFPFWLLSDFGGSYVFLPAAFY